MAHTLYLQNMNQMVAGEGFEPSKAEPGDLQIWGFAEVGSSLAYIAQFSPHIGGIK
jgi:cell wall-associated NlpC family hydrolase